MNEQSNANFIGYLTEVRGNGMDARIAEEAYSDLPLPQLDPERLLAAHIGAYVSIRQSEISLLAIVSKMWEKERFDSDGSRKANRYISLIPVGEIIGNKDFSRGIKCYPSVGAKVYTVSLAALNSIFTRFRSYKFFVGELSSHKGYPVGLDPQAFYSRHFAVLGQSGAGKSWAVTSLIQQSIQAMPKCHIILLDLHGEYYWENDLGIIESPFPEQSVSCIDAQKMDIPYWLMTYAELVDLFIDRADKGASTQMSFMSDVMLQLKRKEAKRIGLTNVSIDTPIYFSLAELYTQFKIVNEEKKDFGKVQGAFYGQFDDFMVRMQSRLNDVRYDFLLKPKKHKFSESMADLLREFVGLGEKKGNITIVDLSGVPSDVRPAVAAQIGRLAYEFNYWNPQRREFPITLICEEAHVYIPREKGGRFEGSKKMMERIAKEGRKYGVSIGVVSQRPMELSETMLAQCSSFICLRTTSPEDQDYIKGLIPESESDLVDTLSSLGRGEALILGEAAPLPTRVQIYKPDPEPKSNDVDYFKGWCTGPDDINVEAIVNLWRTQTRK